MYLSQSHIFLSTISDGMVLVVDLTDIKRRNPLQWLHTNWYIHQYSEKSIYLLTFPSNVGHICYFKLQFQNWTATICHWLQQNTYNVLFVKNKGHNVVSQCCRESADVQRADCNLFFSCTTIFYYYSAKFQMHLPTVRTQYKVIKDSQGLWIFWIQVKVNHPT
jgi:hypothetical protein